MERFSKLIPGPRRAAAALVAAAALFLLAAGAVLAQPLGVRPSATALGVSLTAHPLSIARSTSARFAWRSAGKVSRRTCSLDNGPFRSCGSSVTYTRLRSGGHSFRVRVSDSAGTRRTARWSWLVDTAPPALPVVTGGSLSWRSAAQVTVRAAGSTDSGSGVERYEYRVSADGGPWSPAQTGTSVLVTAQGSTVVEFRAVDRAGNASAWAPGLARAGNTVRLDRTSPTGPRVSGGSTAWQSTASVDVTGWGAMDALSGIEHYEYRTSRDDGATWTSATAGADVAVSAAGVTLVQFRAVDAAGNMSSWQPAQATAASTVKLDRTAPTDPGAAGGSNDWTRAPSVTVTESGSADPHGSGIVSTDFRFSDDGGRTWSEPSRGDSLTVSAEGETLVEFRTTDAAGNQSEWAPSGASPGATVRIDRTNPAPPTAFIVPHGWQNGASVPVTGGGATDPLSGVAGYQYRTSTDSGITWSAPAAGATAMVTAEGQTSVQFRAVDGVGNLSDWAPATVSAANTAYLDRTPPSVPSVAGGSSAWSAGAAGTVLASSSVDSLSGVDHYEYRTSVDGGATWSSPAPGLVALVNADGETLVEFRAVDATGNASAWSPLSAASTIRLDRTGPTDPAVTGGSTAWLSTPGVMVTAGCSLDAQSGVDHYRYRTSTDNGIDWTPPTDGSAVAVTSEGETLVQFQAVDVVGNASAWAPAAPTPGSTVRIDRAAPSAPVVTGGSLSWLSAASATISAGGASDLLSGLDHYEYRTSTDAGQTWSAPTAGSSALVMAEGETVVQMRSVDVAGNTSPWTPGAPDVTDTVRLDRTAPTSPTAARGSAAWQNTGYVSITSGLATDAVSGVDHYEYRSSGDGGLTWTAPTTGTMFTTTAEGEADVQFRAVDQAGNAGPWAPAAGTPAAQSRIDRTPPTDPVVVGGDNAWQSVPSVTVSASGSTDSPGSGVAAYQYRASTDGGVTWGPVTPGASITVTAEGQTIVQFRAVDTSGYTSSWQPAVGAQAGTVRIDRTAPSAPAVTGGSLSWQNAASVAVSGSGALDTGGSGLSGYVYRTSTDGGHTWTPASAGGTATVTGEGQTLVQLAAVDGAGNQSAWAPANATAASTVQIDRTPPTDPVVVGGSLTWSNAASETLTASSTDTPGSGVASYQYRTSTNGGTTWSAASNGSSLVVSTQGETLVQFRSTDAAGTASNWSPAAYTAGGTVRLDHAAPTAPAVAGGSLSWQNTASVTVTGSGSSDSGPSGLAGYQYRTSTDAGKTWSTPASGAGVTITGEGQTLVQVRSLDAAGNTSAWAPTANGAGNTVKIDRSPPTDPVVLGGSGTWSHAASMTITGSGSTDSPGSGVTSYQYRTSTDDGNTWSATATAASVNITAQAVTIVQFRAVDASGQTSNWVPATAGPANTVMLDRVLPTAPTVSGGSLSWQNVASVDVTGSGGVDALSGVSGYEYRTSSDNGLTWSAATAGATATVTAQGKTLVQFRTDDAAGNGSAWAPTAAGAANTVEIDRTPPTDPTTVSGGSLTWRSAASTAVTAAGSTDSPGSGVGSYQYRTSTDGGTTWLAPVTGTTATITAEGETDVQFRAVDVSGLASNWVPNTPTAGSTVRLDRTAPGLPAVSGGSLTWQNVASLTISEAGSTDPLSGVSYYQYRTSTDNGTTWSVFTTGTSVTTAAEGQMLVQFRAVDVAGNISAWAPSTANAGSTARIDRTPPTDPTSVTGGSLTWKNTASTAVTATGSTDSPGSGISTYQYRSSTDGGATWSAPANGATYTVTAEGETDVQFRAVDVSGQTSNWVPSTPTAGSTVRLDRTAPTLPNVAGGSLTWQTVPNIAFSASGATDALSGGVTYQYRTSTDGGTTWSAGVNGAANTVSAEGQTLVQYHAVDVAGNASAWAPATNGAANTARIDRSPPTPATVTGGSLTWQSAASATLTGAGSTDLGSGVSSYEYRTSTDNGASWSLPQPGATATITSEGQTVVQFRAIDGMGFTSAWAPTTANAGSTVRLDRTAPSAPAVNGGSSAWSTAASVTVTSSGAADTGGSGLTTSQYRTSTDGGLTWGAPATANTVPITAEGQTLVQFRSADVAGNTSAWAPTSPTPGSTVQIDRTAPTLPTLSGGSLTWANVPSVTLTATASTDAGSGLASYAYRTSSDGGVTWTAPNAGGSATVTADGETLVQFRATDGVGNTSAWAPASPTAGSTVRIDRTVPTAPTVSGGSTAWQDVSQIVLGAGSSTDPGGSGVASYEYRTSTDGGLNWSAPSPGSSLVVSAEGETLVQFRAVDGVGNDSIWAPSANGTGNTARIDRTTPTAPVVAGGSPGWQSVNSVNVAASGSTDAVSGISGCQYRESNDGGATWGPAQSGATDTITAEGQTDVQFRSIDQAGNDSAWWPVAGTASAMVWIDRSAPSNPVASGGSTAWQQAASVTVTGGGSTDALSGGVTYYVRTSSDAGQTWSTPAMGSSATVAAEGQTLVQFQAVDAAGNASPWSPAPSVPQSTVRIDRSIPTPPTVTGGSLGWQSVPSVLITAGGATDGLSGVTAYQYRTSTDGGITWSSASPGAAALITGEGETLVQFSVIDNAGNASAWAPAAPTAGSTARIDRTIPLPPTVSGGGTAWQSVPSVSVSASGGSDSGSGVAGYQYRTSADGGTTWSKAVDGGIAQISADGQTLVQFRTRDLADNPSAWAPATPQPTSTVDIDRSAPSLPVPSGGSASWQSVQSVTVTAGSSTDALSGMASYEHRTSTDGGANWSAASPGGSFTAPAEGQTLVQFRAIDNVGNISAWAPAAAAPANTIRIDRTNPGVPP
jgi:hypothetical protein